MSAKIQTIDERIDRLMQAPYALTRYQRQELARLLAEDKRRRVAPDSLIACLRARNPETDPDCHEAAATIERLTTAMHRIIEADPYMPDDPDEETYERNRRANQMAQIARVALSGGSAPNQ